VSWGFFQRIKKPNASNMAMGRINDVVADSAYISPTATDGSIRKASTISMLPRICSIIFRFIASTLYDIVQRTELVVGGDYEYGVTR
jgi:hypothetical protein